VLNLATVFHLESLSSIFTHVGVTAIQGDTMLLRRLLRYVKAWVLMCSGRWKTAVLMRVVIPCYVHAWFAMMCVSIILLSG